MTYEYECPNCGKVFERQRRADESSLPADCPDCGEESPRIISHGIAAHFKGSGFYATDYGKPRPFETDEDN